MVERKIISIITALVLVESLQALALIAHIYSFIPISLKGPILPGLEPERESFLYIIFLAMVFVLTIVLTALLYKPLKSAAFQQRALKFVYLETLWMGLMLFAFFKWVSYQHPFYNILPLENGRWVYPFFYAVAFLSFLTKIFWAEIVRFWESWEQGRGRRLVTKEKPLAVYAAGIMFAAALLYPNVPLASQVIASWSRFAPWQNFWLTRFFLERGFSPEAIIACLYGLNMIVLGVIFVGAHRYLKNSWLAFGVLMLTIQMTFFHYGTSPVCWNAPQNTLINFGWDFGFMKDAAHLPMFAALRVRQFLSFFMGYAIAVLYVFSILYCWGKDRMAVILSGLGLLLYTRYIAHADVFAFGAASFPAMILSAHWLRIVIRRFFPKQENAVYIALAATSVFMLLTNRVFVTYPHFWMNNVP